MEKVSVIIPAHNEHDRIAGVLAAVEDHPLLHEVIVVDDGSTDHTADVARQFSWVKLIEQKKNQGKSLAVFTGINAASGTVIFLLDADLVGLTPKNITEMIEPVLADSADITISLRKNTPLFNRLIGLDYISGERVFYRKLLDQHLARLSQLHGFGLEVFLNQLIIENRYRIKIVFWPHVISPGPHNKYGWRVGIKRFLGMLSHMLKTISVGEMAYQIFTMLRLRVK